MLTLNCWIRGGDDTVFDVETSPNERIGAVKQKIKDYGSGTFGDVAPQSLRLYKLNAPVPFDGLSAVTLSTSGVFLSDAMKVRGVFATQPHEDHIHLIVDYPLILYYIRGTTGLVNSHVRISGSTMLSQLRTLIKAKHESLHSTPEDCIAFYRPLASTTRHELDKSFDSLPVGPSFNMDTLVSNAFLDVPVLRDICIVVQVTEYLSHGEKRPPSLSSDLEKTKRRKMGPKSMVDFHTEIWDRKSDAHARVFETMSIERPQLAGVEVPTSCCIMKSPPYGGGSSYLSGVLIRDEFVLAVGNIVAFYKGEDVAGDSKGNDDEADTTVGYDEGVDTTMGVSVGAAESSVVQTGFQLAFTNPFLAPNFPPEGKKPGIIVTGAPGIGKSVLLEFILHLRNLAGLPTLFVRDEKRVDLFASDGVFRYKGPLIDRSELPPSVWVLVDSNTELVGVPEWVRNLGCFIVQAASPRPDRLHWALKEAGVSWYIMKMWSLEEVLAARTLQVKSPPSAAQLTTFFELYGPSARAAYSFAHRIQDFESQLQAAIDSLSLDHVTKMVDDLASLRVNAELPHRLFIIHPGETRSSLIIKFASQHISEKLVAALESKVSSAARVLFEVYNRNAPTKALAGQLLDSVVRGVFTRGGVWPIHRMELSPMKGKVNQHWKIVPSKSYVDQYLVVGDPTKPIVKICDTCPNDGTVYDTFSPFPFNATTKKLTETGYYLPTSTTEATFDAFYYDADLKEATVLQATVSPVHTMKAKGLQRLQEVGVESVCYVAVTGPGAGFDLPVPKNYDGVFVKEKYHLVLPKLT
ncbi:hypothetical protein HD554DRAFT_2316226 [Boletus coccyginus]|nr:hypothetical protein HD554DRAFT_2316226 [Boletus coccyginus]